MRLYKIEEWFYDSLERYGIIPLPQLRSYFERHWIDSTTFLRTLGPRVVEVAFSNWYYSTYRPKVPFVASLWPSLRVFRFYGDHRFNLSRLYPALLEALPHLEVLYSPESYPVPDDVLRHILSSGVLRELEVANLPVDFRRCMPSGAPLRLRRFGLKTKGLEDWDEVLASLDTTQLQSIKVRYVEGAKFPLASQVRNWFEMVAAHCSTSLLTKIEFHGPRDANDLLDDPGEEYRITTQTVEPLLRIRILEELVISSPAGFHLDNDSLRVFSQSWPRMRRLDLDSRFLGWSDISDYDISLDGLAILAQSWPNLEHLNLFLIARADSFGDSIQDVNGYLENLNLKGASGCWTLRSLKVGFDSPVVYRPLVVAAFLHGIFPNLRNILGLEDAGFAESLPEEWMEVEDVLRYSIRLRERTLQARRLG